MRGDWYHVTSRGLERRRIFREEGDRQQWISLLARLPERFGVCVHGYAKMENHFHLLLETPEANLSQAVQWLNVSYAIWFNRRHQRAGPLYQGRFKAELIDEEEWLLEVSRYLHLNPVRTKRWKLSASERPMRERRLTALSGEDLKAALDHLKGWKWSSYRAYAGYEEEPRWLTCHVLLARFHGRCGRQRREYQRYVEEALRLGAACRRR